METLRSMPLAPTRSRTSVPKVGMGVLDRLLAGRVKLDGRTYSSEICGR